MKLGMSTKLFDQRYRLFNLPRAENLTSDPTVVPTVLERKAKETYDGQLASPIKGEVGNILNYYSSLSIILKCYDFW